MEKLYIKFREELESGEILNPDSPSLNECVAEFRRMGYKECNSELEGYGIITGDNEGDYITQRITAQEAQEYGYKEHFLTPKYREVYVSDVSVEQALKDKEKRIFLAELPGKTPYKYSCVRKYQEAWFRKGEEYHPVHWKYIAEIPKEEPAKEMTHSEVEKELGYPIKIIK